MEQKIGMAAWIGIDPGLTGYMAAIVEGGETGLSQTVLIPLGPDTIAFLRSAGQGYSKCCAVVEEAETFKGGAGSLKKYVTTYGQAIGWLEMAVIPHRIVRSSIWKKEMGVLVRKTKTKPNVKQSDKKLRALAEARRLFPHIATTELSRMMDHNKADALLLAVYCRQVFS